MRHIGFGLVQQLQEKCRHCNGEGEIIKNKDRCKACNGAKITEEAKVLDVFVDKGMKHGQKIVFSGEGDQAPDVIPGDVVLILQQKEHPIFRREGDDLHMEKKVPLVEALCGVRFTITHLDGRVLVVNSTPGEVVKPGDVKCIQGEGMPQYRNPFQKGRLFIKFNVEFPEDGSIPPSAFPALMNVLPKSKPMGAVPPEAEEVHLLSVDMSQENGQRRRRAESYDSDEDEDEPPRGGVSCQHQ